MTVMTPAIASRHSTRSFKVTPLPEEDIVGIVEAACAAPSSKNQQLWHIVRMDQPDLAWFADTLEAHFLSENYEGPRNGPVATMRAMRDAPLALFVFSDEDPSSPLRTPAIQSVGAAIQNMVLEAETRGIASLWCCDILYAYEVSISILGDDGDLMAAVVLGYEDRITPRKTHKTPDQVLTTFCRE